MRTAMTSTSGRGAPRLAPPARTRHAVAARVLSSGGSRTNASGVPARAELHDCDAARTPSASPEPPPGAYQDTAAASKGNAFCWRSWTPPEVEGDAPGRRVIWRPAEDTGGTAAPAPATVPAPATPSAAPAAAAPPVSSLPSASEEFHPMHASADVIQLPRPMGAGSSNSTAPTPRKAAAPGQPVLGHSEGHEVLIDLEKLVKTRMFICAAPNGGKSHTLRRILEQTHSMIQQLVIDPEGELVTLADKFDYLVLAADSEETPLRTETAGELAQQLWRSGHSAILCLEAMEVEEMQAFVGAFYKGLMAVRKEHWHPLILAVDEGQLFAPQQDKAESKKPMIDVVARGRKRGICPIVATQRVSQIHKGVVSFLQNNLVGLTTLDNDIERAADMLGMKSTRVAETLRTLDTGEFMTFGPALGHQVVKVKVGPVETQHGVLDRFSEKRRRRPIAKDKILGAIKELGTPPPVDVPQQAEAAAKGPSKEDLRMKIAEFRCWVISPLLDKAAKYGATADRCRQLQLQQSEVGQWLATFKARYDLRDLQPKNVGAKMVENMVRLSTLMTQETAHNGQPAAFKLAAAAGGRR